MLLLPLHHAALSIGSPFTLRIVTADHSMPIALLLETVGKHRLTGTLVAMKFIAKRKISSKECVIYPCCSSILRRRH